MGRRHGHSAPEAEAPAQLSLGESPLQRADIEACAACGEPGPRTVNARAWCGANICRVAIAVTPVKDTP